VQFKKYLKSQRKVILGRMKLFNVSSYAFNHRGTDISTLTVLARFESSTVVSVFSDKRSKVITPADKGPGSSIHLPLCLKGLTYFGYNLGRVATTTTSTTWPIIIMNSLMAGLYSDGCYH